MPFINVNLNAPEVQESKPVKNGRYDLVVLSVTEGKSKEKQNPQLIVEIGFETEPNTPNLRQYISLPSASDEPKTSTFKMLMLKRFCGLFKVPFDDRGFDTDSMIGARASAEVTTQSGTDMVGRNIKIKSMPG
jgi:hypothetical protein